MSQIVYRANLSSAYFPLLSTNQGRTVIIGGPDNNFNRQVQTSTDLDKDIGIPQVYYCENVLPTETGYASVGYIQAALIPAAGAYYKIATISVNTIAATNDALLAVKYNGMSLLRAHLGISTSYWVNINTYTDIASASVAFPAELHTKTFTSAKVEGNHYFALSNLGVFRATAVDQILQVELLGLIQTDILGITETNGYLIACTKTSVYWSSLLNSLDFAPSLETGAGGGQVEGLKGDILGCFPTSTGFVVYSKNNSVSVIYTGNSRYPFQFSEATGSGGIDNLEAVAYDSNDGSNYAYTSKGMQVMQNKTAATVLPYITDFLAQATYETFNLFLAPEFVLTRTTETKFRVKLTLVASRYLIISYGLGGEGVASFIGAIVFDVVLKRLGKLNISHVACFEYKTMNSTSIANPRNCLAFLDVFGNVYLTKVGTDNDVVQGDGVVILGKYQYVRSRKLQLQEVEIENIATAVSGTASSQIYCATSYDGKSFDSITPGTHLNTTTKNKLMASVGFGSPVGMNHSVIITGAFDLNTVELKFNVQGRM